MKKQTIILIINVFIASYGFSVGELHSKNCVNQVDEKIATIVIEGKKYSFQVHDDYYNSVADRMKSTVNAEMIIVESILFTPDRNCEIVFSMSANEAQINDALTHIVTNLGFSAYKLE